MTSDLCTEDVVVRITTPQIISPESIVSVSSCVGVSSGAATSRVAASSAAVDLGRRLLLAARAGDTTLVLDLMAKGAPFTTDWLGTSPLHLAAGNAHLDTCAVLLRAGVSRDARTKVERTPLHLAAGAGHHAVVRLLLDAGANVDCRDMLRMTPLHWAVQRGHSATVSELLAHGADPSAVSKFHKTPRSLAVELRRDDLLRLIDDAIKEREAARSVHHLVNEQMAEAPTPEPQLQSFDAVRRIQDIKPVKTKQQPEKVAKTEIKAERAAGGSSGSVGSGVPDGSGVPGGSGGSGVSGGSGAAARLLRAHGITLLPADNSSTVLNALHSGRTIVLSDAGKLMLKESGETAQPAASKPSPAATQPNKNMVLTATPVKSPPKPGMKIFTLNNKLLALPKESNKIPIKKIINPQDMQVKLLPLPGDAKIISPSKLVPVRRSAGGARPAVKIIMNKSNFERLVANAARGDDGSGEAAAGADGAGAGEAEGEESAASLRAQLAAARRALGALRGELRAARARLARYEPHQL